VIVSSSVQDRLLDATEVCLRRDGIRRTTVAGVAEQAGVSRAWLYRHFPDKASLIGAALVRLDESFWDAARTRIGGARGLPAQVAEAVVLARQIQPQQLVLQLREQEPEAFAAVLGTGVREVVPGLAIPRAAEWVLRVVLSLVTVPGDAVDADDPASVRAYVQEFLVPGLS
jgi:AcrR family transcriptional regulator